MASATSINLLIDEVWAFLAQDPSPQAIIAFRPSEALQSRLEYLLEVNREARISSEEHQELEALAQLNQFMRMLKIRAHEKASDLI
jgi:hypothetical protein